jgi:hypothetical protein
MTTKSPLSLASQVCLKWVLRNSFIIGQQSSRFVLYFFRFFNMAPSAMEKDPYDIR